MEPQKTAPVVTALLFGVLFLATVDNQLLIPLLPLLGRELDVSAQALGGLFSAYALAAALLNLLFGPLLDRFGRVPFLRLGLLGFAAFAFLTAQAKSYPQLLSLRAGTGMMAGLLSTSTASFIGDFFPYQRRGRVMGIVLSSYFAALILGVPVGAWMAQYWDWRMVFRLSALLALGLLACSFRWFSREPAFRGFAAPFRLSVYWRLLCGRTTSMAAAVSFLISGATLSILAFIAPHLHHTFDLQPVQIAWLFVVAGIAAVCASPAAGWLTDRWSKRQVFLLANTVLAGLVLLIDCLPWGPLLVGLFFVLSLCIAFRQTALHTLQTELVGLEQRGSFLALRNSASELGIAVSVFLAGNLYSTVGYGAVTVFAAFLTVLGSALLYYTIPEPVASHEN